MAAIYGLALSAQATIDMHSLNNEGGEGNQIQTRMVDVMGEDRRLHNVNAISGDMFKHIQAEHLFRLALGGGAPLCAACARFDANRISADPNFRDRISSKEVKPANVIDDMLRTCIVDDLEGNLITTGARSVPRKSVVEFGWVVGVPGKVRTEQYFHVKYNPADPGQADAAAPTTASPQTGQPTEPDRTSNLGQAIFHRPASSGVYAIVCHLEPARIGYNDIAQRYAIGLEERTARLRLLLQSVLFSFVQMNGAMRNTQLPHLVAFEGVITVSHALLPAPTVSPLNSAYRTQIAGVCAALNGLAGPAAPGAGVESGAISQHAFASLDEFAGTLAGLIAEATPYAFAER